MSNSVEQKGIRGERLKGGYKNDWITIKWKELQYLLLRRCLAFFLEGRNYNF